VLWLQPSWALPEAAAKNGEVNLSLTFPGHLATRRLVACPSLSPHKRRQINRQVTSTIKWAEPLSTKAQDTHIYQSEHTPYFGSHPTSKYGPTGMCLYHFRSALFGAASYFKYAGEAWRPRMLRPWCELPYEIQMQLLYFRIRTRGVETNLLEDTVHLNAQIVGVFCTKVPSTSIFRS
jgi:hypothetical protein